MYLYYIVLVSVISIMVFEIVTFFTYIHIYSTLIEIESVCFGSLEFFFFLLISYLLDSTGERNWRMEIRSLTHY